MNVGRLMLWHNWLRSHCVTCTYIRGLVQVLATLLLIQLSTNAPGRHQIFQKYLNCRIPHGRPRWSSSLLASASASPTNCGY